MRHIRALILGVTMLNVALLPMITIVPTIVSAAEYSGTSPSFSTGTTWSLSLGTFGSGHIVEWDWDTADSLLFYLTLDGYPFAANNHDGIVTWTTGSWGLSWYNDNLFFSATVSYWVAVFEPWTTVTAPLEGAYANSRAVSLQGMTDSYSSGVLAGLDAMHLKEATWSGDNWQVSDVILNEGQNTILVRTYYWLDWYGYNNITYDRILHVTVDTIAPELLITNPVNNTFHKGDLVVTWQCSDTNEIVKTEIKFDAWGWEDVTGTSHQADLTDGNHTVQVRVTDPAGNQETRSATFTADSTPPELTIFGPAEGSTTSSKRVSFGGTDNIGIMMYWINSDYSGWLPALTGTEYDLVMADGPHTVQVKLTDKAENEIVRTVNFTLDTELPTAIVTGPAVGTDIRGGYVDVTWQCTDNLGIAVIEMSIDGLAWQSVSGSEFKDLWLPSGYHVIQIRVTDNAGNQATASTSFNSDNRALSFSGPYYGLPTVGIILAIVVVAIVALMMLRRRKGGPTMATVPREEPAVEAP